MHYNSIPYCYAPAQPASVSSYTVKQPSPSSLSHNSSQTQDPHSCSSPASSSSAGSLEVTHSLVYPRIQGPKRVQRTLAVPSLSPQDQQLIRQSIRESVLTESIKALAVFNQRLLLLSNLLVQVNGFHRPPVAGAGKGFFEPVCVLGPGEAS